MVTRSTNLLTGIAQSRAWHSTESSSFDTVLISNLVNSREDYQFATWCAALHMRRPIALY